MFNRIVVAYDGSDSARAALRIGIDLAKSLGGELSSISVEEHLPRYAATISEVAGAQERIEEHFRTLTKQARDTAAVEEVDLETVVRRGHEVGEILEFVRARRADLLLLGAHGHSRVFERFIGSTSLSVARAAPCSVLIVRPSRRAAEGLGRVKRIVVGLDGSPLGRLALRVAFDLAILCEAAVTGVTVQEGVRPAGSPGFDPTYIQQLKAAAEEHARAARVVFTHVTRSGHAAQGLREAARETGADLLVLGATGLEQPWSAAIGGTASSVAGESQCSVLLVRSPAAALRVSDIMGTAVSSVTVDAPLTEVVELLLRRSVKALPVLDARRHVAGIVTGGDLLSRGDMPVRLSVKHELDEDTLRGHLRALARGRKTARDVMTRHVQTITPEADLAEAIRLMTARRVKRLPVVNRDKELVGIVSRADVLRAIAALPEASEQHRPVLPATARTIAEATITDVPVVSPRADVEEVLQALLSSPLRRVVVVDDRRTVLGLISDRDILARSSAHSRPWLVRMLLGGGAARLAGAHGEPLTATALTAPSLITVRPEDSLADAIRLMMQHQVKRLVVVDDAGRLVGLVDRREVLRLLADESG